MGRSRAAVLDMAKQYVMEDRATEHGDLEDNFYAIAAYWSNHLGVVVSVTDVAVMMCLLKVARLKSNPGNNDNWLGVSNGSDNTGLRDVLR